MSVRVVGMISPSYTIEDLSLIVAYGKEEVISAEKALESKDLWKAISTGKLFQFKALTGSPPPLFTPPVVSFPPAPVVTAPSSPVGADIVRLLQAKLDQDRVHHAELVALLQGIQEGQRALNETLKQRPVVTTVQATSPAFSSSPAGNDEVPYYIPRVDIDKDSVSMEVKEETVADPSVKASANKLKELRKKNGTSGSQGEGV